MLETGTTPVTAVSEGTVYPERDSVFEKLLFAQDQLARKEEELRGLRDRIKFLEQTPFQDPLTPVFSGTQTEGQSSDKKKRNKRRWLLGRAKAQKEGPASGFVTQQLFRGILRIRHH